MPKIPPRLQEQLDRIKEVETTMLQLVEHLKYPVDHNGHVLDMNHLPDVPHTIAHHLTKLGWRHHPDKALIKPRRVVGAGFYEDLVTYVPVSEPDDPLEVTPASPPQREVWETGPPTVNMIDEERSDHT
jgi:hypothetical protein